MCQKIFLGVIAAWYLLFTLAARAEDKASVYVVLRDRAILDSQARDALTRDLIVGPALELSRRYEYTFKVRADCGKPTCSLMSLVDKYFDYYPKKFSKTSHAIESWVSSYNNLHKMEVGEGQILFLPSVPVKPNETFDLNGVRVYDPSTQSYVQGTTIPSTSSGVRRVAPVGGPEARRQANETIWKLTLDQYRTLFKKPPSSSYATVYFAGPNPSEPGKAIVRLLQGSGAPFVSSRSPYQPLWISSWKGRDTQEFREQLLLRASMHPLVLVDWDFVSGHGRTVYIAAKAGLENLGLGFLEPRCVELNPVLNREGLKSYLLEFCRGTSKSCIPSPAGDQPSVSIDQIRYEKALDWLDKYVPVAESLEQQLDEFVLEAVLWGVFHQGDWANLSFQILPEEAYAPLETILPDSMGFGFVAAGNEPSPVRAQFFPQKLARVWPGRFINITFGAPDGRVDGSYSSTDGGELTDVAVLAQGEALPHPNFPSAARGSSYASPWVAAAVWAESALRGVENQDVLSEVVRASRPVPTLNHPVVSGGFFDPFLLLIGTMCSLTAKNGQVTDLKNGHVEYTYIDPVDGVQTQRISICSGRHGSLRIFRDGQSVKLWRRDSSGVRALDLLTLSAVLTTVDSAQLNLGVYEWADGYEEINY